MGLKSLVEGWVLKVALKKAVKAAVAYIASAAASAKIAPLLAQFGQLLAQFGVSLEPGQLEVGLTALGTGAITMLLNWLKVKTRIGQKLL